MHLGGVWSKAARGGPLPSFLLRPTQAQHFSFLVFPPTPPPLRFLFLYCRFNWWPKMGRGCPCPARARFTRSSKSFGFLCQHSSRKSHIRCPPGIHPSPT